MLSLITFLSCLSVISLSANLDSSYLCPAANATCDIVCGTGANGTVDCSDSVINGSLATILNITCPTEISCNNLTTICPSGNTSSCIITCTDSFSCDGVIMNSPSATTSFNCMTSTVNKTNICSNNIINLMGSDIDSATINCSVPFVTETPDPVCYNMSLNSNESAAVNGVVSFYCMGDGIKCDMMNISASNIDTFDLQFQGQGAEVMNSQFMGVNNTQFTIVMSERVVVSNSIFDGIVGLPDNDGLVEIEVIDGSELSNNSFSFGGDNFTIFEMIGGDATKMVASYLVNNNSISIMNAKTASLVNINSDNSTSIMISESGTLEIKCGDDQPDLCGGFGEISAEMLEEITVIIGNSVNYTSSIAATNVSMISITMSSGSILQGLDLRTTAVNTSYFDIYGKSVQLDCYGMCENLEIKGYDISESQNVTNPLQIECGQDSKCSNIKISGPTINGPNIAFICNETECDYIDISNIAGGTMVEIAGVMSQSSMSGNPLYIIGNGTSNMLQYSTIDGLLNSGITSVTGLNSFGFKHNTFKVNSNVTISTDGTGTFTNNVIASATSSMTVTLNADIANASIYFTKPNSNTYTFWKSKDVYISLSSGQELKDQYINVINTDASVHIMNQGGTLVGNTIGAENTNYFVFQQSAGRMLPTSPNKFKLEGVNQTYFYVSGENILDSKNIDIVISQVTNILLSALSGGQIEDVVVAGIGVTLNSFGNNTEAQEIFINNQANMMAVNAEIATISVNDNLVLDNFIIDATNSTKFTVNVNSAAIENSLFRVNDRTSLSFQGDEQAMLINTTLVGNENDTSNLSLCINNDEVTSKGFDFTKLGSRFIFTEASYVNITALPPFENNTINAETVDELVFGWNDVITANFRNTRLKINDNTLKINGNGTFIAMSNTSKASFNGSIESGDSRFTIFTKIAENGFVSINKTMNSYTFDGSDGQTIDISTIDIQDKFVNNTVNIVNPRSTLNIMNSGGFNRNIFQADTIDYLNVYCMKRCGLEKPVNYVKITNITKLVTISANASGKMIGEMLQLKVSRIGSIQINADENSTISDFKVNDTMITDQVMVTNYGAINNLMIDASGADFFTLQCWKGCRATTTPNHFILQNVSNIQLVADNDEINTNNTLLDSVHNVKALILMSVENGIIRDLEFMDFVDPSPFGSISIYSRSGGILSGLYIDAQDANTFILDCNGMGCSKAMEKNQFALDGVNVATFSAINDTIDSSNTEIVNGSIDISSLTLSADVNGMISGLDIASNETEMILVKAMDGGQIQNVQIEPDMLDMIKVMIDGGMAKNVNIEPGMVSKVVVSSENGTYTNSVIDATTSSNLSVICSGKKTMNGKSMGNCNELTLHVPTAKSASATLKCDQNGCQDMIFYTENGIEDIDISLRCKCSEAIKTACVEEFSFYCAADENTASVFVNNTCKGDCCGDVVDDLRVDGCDYGGGSSKSHTGAIVGGICGGILVVVIIAAAVYYMRKKRSAESEALLVNNTQN